MDKVSINIHRQYARVVTGDDGIVTLKLCSIHKIRLGHSLAPYTYILRLS
jgi:hypothetical protein